MRGVVFEDGSAEATFAENMKQARIAKGMTQADLAEAMTRRGFKWYGPTVYKVENGDRQILLGEAIEVAEILGYELADLAMPEGGGKTRATIISAYADATHARGRMIQELRIFLNAAEKLRGLLSEPGADALVVPDADMREVSDPESPTVRAATAAHDAAMDPIRANVRKKLRDDPKT